MSLSKLSVSLLALAGSAVGADLPSIVAKGSKFFYPNGTQFFIKGVAYQQDVGQAGTSISGNSTFIDPLSSEDSCKRDVPLLQQLGTNVIRTYAIDPTADHSACMKLLNDAGIYVFSDLGEPSLSINRDNPSWNVELFTRYKAVVDELQKYPNVIGYFAGNEVSNAKNNTAASAYVKAAVRDTKAYISSKKYRWMGVGYAANDDVDIRAEIADYFNCGDQTDAIDFWGYNIYSWCGQSDAQKSGYDEQTTFFSNYSVPVFFAEYGCNEPSGAAERIFQETAALYGDSMSAVFSGGIVYMFFEEANDYGLVTVKGNTVTKMKDFTALQTQVTKASPKGVDESSYKPSNSPATCPALTDSWQASNILPPTPDASLCTCMQNSLSCVRSGSLDANSYGDIFGYICGSSPQVCAGINGNAATGVYGAYHMCDDGAKLDYVLDAYYQSQNKASSACDFKGQAQVVSAKPASSCSSALASASAINKQAATATTPVGGGSTSTAGGSTSSSAAVAGRPVSHLLSIGEMSMALYLGVATLVGVGMIAL
ncbi:glycoside hydrolase family 72 protein [Trichoderma cornu-damae]|uniref:1,3-beta-glucanosyltransferase n=1 Tax=Trichoderma cornu-damae TaxID=654480 RepID=A0A9P8QET3_9HYPO|nr:glycoside hydrolase family 72 protein [Trichoderma cornu-damae]